ncbi:MAG: RagB/SusD family nutrient uptake outer membrane protein [Gemmatimonadota bacterium]
MKRLVLGAMTLSAAGCSDDILDLQPLSQYSDALVWNDLNLVQAYVNPLYNSIRGLNNAGSIHVSFLDYAGYADESYNRHNYGGTNALYSGAWNAGNFGSQIWNNRYDMIQRLNIFFERIGDVPGDDALRTRLMGEARFLRAYYYAELAKHYGDVPLITDPFELGDDYAAGIGRTPFDDVVQWVTSELDQAVTELPSQSEQPDSDLGRATTGAALAVKADLLLYAASPLHNSGGDLAKWTAASNAARAVIDLGEYSLFQGDYYDLTMGSFWNSEIIFGRIYAGLYNTPNSEVWLMTNGFGGWSAYTPQQQFVDAYRMANGLPITDPASGYDPDNPYVGREARFYGTILHDGAVSRGRELEFWYDDEGQGGRDTGHGIQPWNASLTGHAFRKFHDEERDLAAGRAGFRDRVWPTFRLSEMYLSYAEAQYELGNDGVARDYLNDVRTRPTAGLPPSTAAGPALMDDIREERRIELALESKRYFDLLRWQLAEEYLNDPARGVNITRHADGTRSYEYFELRDRVWNPAYYFWPIPESEMQRTDLPQNPGY